MNKFVTMLKETEIPVHFIPVNPKGKDNAKIAGKSGYLHKLTNKGIKILFDVDGKEVSEWTSEEFEKIKAEPLNDLKDTITYNKNKKGPEISKNSKFD